MRVFLIDFGRFFENFKILYVGMVFFRFIYFSDVEMIFIDILFLKYVLCKLFLSFCLYVRF